MKEEIKRQRNIDYYMGLPYSILLHEIDDEGEKYWIAEIVELPGCKTHGSTVREAVRNVEEAKKDWILDGLDRGEEIPVPVERERFSGKTLVRMSRSLHHALVLMAESENLSLNQLIVTILAKEIGRLNTLNRVERKLDELLDIRGSQLRYERIKKLIEQQYLDSRHVFDMLSSRQYYPDLVARLRASFLTDDAPSRPWSLEDLWDSVRANTEAIPSGASHGATQDELSREVV